MLISAVFKNHFLHLELLTIMHILTKKITLLNNNFFSNIIRILLLYGALMPNKFIVNVIISAKTNKQKVNDESKFTHYPIKCVFGTSFHFKN